MREIKFRVPMFFNSGKFSHFTYWGRINHECESVFDKSCFSSPGQSNVCTGGDDEQFAGLHDKNGKDIYEGDMRRGGYVVKYLSNKASFMWVSQVTKDTVFIRSICSDDEVIGSIHENPELLND